MIEEFQEVQCRQLRKVKTPEGPSHWRDPTRLCVLTSEMLPGSHSEYWRKTPQAFGKGRGKVILEYTRAFSSSSHLPLGTVI